MDEDKSLGCIAVKPMMYLDDLEIANLSASFFRDGDTLQYWFTINSIGSLMHEEKMFGPYTNLNYAMKHAGSILGSLLDAQIQTYSILLEGELDRKATEEFFQENGR
jgi:hypothetical protein